MMAVCHVIPNVDGFPSGLLGYLDCQAQALGLNGYAALAAPGSAASAVMNTLLTLFVALFGIRLLFGEAIGVRDGVLAAVKIGIVLTLAGSWPAYRTLVYDVVLRAPAQLVEEIGAPSGLPGVAGDLPTRLDRADQALSALAIYGVGMQSSNDTARQAPPLFVGFDTFALGASRVVFLTSAIASFALLRLAAGLLLALGPLFAAFLLFAATRGLFGGWLRGLIGISIGALATGIALAVELALLQPWLADLLARRLAQQSIVGVPAQLLAVTIVFAVATGGLLLLALRLVREIRFDAIDWRQFDINRAAPPLGQLETNSLVRTRHEERSRAMAVADAVSAGHRRTMVLVGGGPAAGTNRAAQMGDMPSDSRPIVSSRATAIPLGRTGARRTLARRSASAGRRDQRA